MGPKNDAAVTVSAEQDAARQSLEFMCMPDIKPGCAVPARTPANIRNRLDRFLDLWHDMPGDQWAELVAAAHRRLAALERGTQEAPAHHEVEVGEQMDLFGGAA